MHLPGDTTARGNQANGLRAKKSGKKTFPPQHAYTPQVMLTYYHFNPSSMMSATGMHMEFNIKMLMDCQDLEYHQIHGQPWQFKGKECDEVIEDAGLRSLALQSFKAQRELPDPWLAMAIQRGRSVTKRLKIH